VCGRDDVESSNHKAPCMTTSTIIDHLKSLVTTRMSSPAQQVQWNDKVTVQPTSQVEEYLNISIVINSYITRFVSMKDSTGMK
jgi:hypothetical protein